MQGQFAECLLGSQISGQISGQVLQLPGPACEMTRLETGKSADLLGVLPYGQRAWGKDRGVSNELGGNPGFWKVLCIETRKFSGARQRTKRFK